MERAFIVIKEERWFAKLGNLVAGSRSKWVTLIVWLALAILLSVFFPSVNKMENNSAASLPNQAASVEATQTIQKAFPSHNGVPALIVWYESGGLTTKSLASVQKAAKAIAAHPLPGQKSVVPLQKMPLFVVASLRSKDHTTLVLPVNFNATLASTTLAANMTKLQTTINLALGHDVFSSSLTASGLHARITGPAGIASDALGLFKNADITLLAATTMLVLILLILLYRSPIMAFVPLIAVGFAYMVISPVLGMLAKTGVIVVDAQGVSIMTVLLFGAGTDYCLFLVSRYRERLYHEKNQHLAMKEALGGAGGAIAMSGLTVVVSLFTLLLAVYGSDHRFAVPFSVAILIMAIAGVTLVPALLAIFGRWSFFPFIPYTPELWDAKLARKKSSKKMPSHLKRRGQPGRISQWIGNVVAKKPWPVTIISLILLAILASFSMQIKTTYNILTSFPATMPSREGFTLLADHFSSGSLAPVQVVIQGGHAASVKSSIADLPFVKSVSTPTKSTKIPSDSLLQVTLKSDPYSNQAMNQMSTLKTTIMHTLQQDGVNSPTGKVWIGGETATQQDTKYYTLRDTRVIIPVVIVIIALLLLVYLRSIVAMVYLIATVLLSFFAALGTGWIILHHIMGATAIQGAIPLYAFVFLVALGEDYNIFMISRIWQEHTIHDLKTAIFRGVSSTSTVITSAGLILAGTFAVLATLPIQVLVQFGIVTAVGVLLDTFIVRPFLVPSITAILGSFSFWPGKIKEQSESLAPAWYED